MGELNEFMYQMKHKCGYTVRTGRTTTFLDPFYVGGARCPKCGSFLPRHDDRQYRIVELIKVRTKKKLLGLIPYTHERWERFNDND